MKAKLVGHVRHFVRVICCLREYLERAFFRLVEVDRGPGISCLSETSFEDLHDTVCVGVTADCQHN